MGDHAHPQHETTRQAHWQGLYRDTPEQRTSWFRPHLDASLRWIDGLSLAATAPLIDIGGGRSTLVDDLLAGGFRDVTVLDIADEALRQSRMRLGRLADAVSWLVGDVLDAELPRAHYALWHDRAVFHFLIAPEARRRYAALAARAVKPGGYLLIATFAADGPARCSGLPVARYDADALAACFAPAFEAIDAGRDMHRTPFDTEQAFTHVLLRRIPAEA